MSANDYQVGGEHYKKKYQHWDFACDTNIPYIIGCATKYIARWRSKAGLEDLMKSHHYLCKADELSIYYRNDYHYWELFISDLEIEDQQIMIAIYQLDFKKANKLISVIVERLNSQEPGDGYINQD